MSRRPPDRRDRVRPLQVAPDERLLDEHVRAYKQAAHRLLEDVASHLNARESQPLAADGVRHVAKFREHLLHVFTRMQRLPALAFVFVEFDLVFAAIGIGHQIEQGLVEIRAAEPARAFGGEDPDIIAVDFEDRDIKRATAKVINHRAPLHTLTWA